MPALHERAVIELLARKWVHSGPPGILDVSEFVGLLVKFCKHYRHYIITA